MTLAERETRPAAADSQLAEMLLQHEIEKLVNIEALLLDERRFEEWLDLFSDDVHYWMPTRTVRYERELHKEHSLPDEVAHFDETKRGLEERVTRIRSGMAWAEEPPSRTRHLITNLEVLDGSTDDEARVYSSFLTYRSRLEGLQGDEDFFVGRREDTLRRVDGEWKLARRRIISDAVVINAQNLSIFF